MKLNTGLWNLVDWLLKKPIYKRWGPLNCFLQAYEVEVSMLRVQHTQWNCDKLKPLAALPDGLQGEIGARDLRVWYSSSKWNQNTQALDHI